MARVNISNPVAVSHPVSQQFITLSKGQEFPDDDPIVKEFGWAFEQKKRPGRPRKDTSE